MSFESTNRYMDKQDAFTLIGACLGLLGGAKELKQIHLGQIIHELFKLHVGPILKILLVSLLSVSVMSAGRAKPKRNA